MDLYGIGYSNIRLPNNTASYMYTYNPRINTFPEEVFLHEFLHTLERILIEREYDIPALHDYSKYNYKEEKLIGLKNWYTDYMNCNIKTSNGQFIGLDEEVYKLTPPAESDFKYHFEIEFSHESENIIEELNQIFNYILKIFRKK